MTRSEETLTRTRARRVAALFLVSLCAVLMSHAQAFAQAEPSSTPEERLMCYYGPGQYVPCDSTPPQGPDPFQWSKSRYESVRARLRAFGIKTGEGQPLAQTPDELSRQVDALYVGAAYTLDRLVFDSNQKARDARDAESDLQDIYAHERALQARANEMPAALHEASDGLTRALADAEAWERVVASVEQFADRMRARADRAALESLQWLTVASPTRALLVNEQMVSERKRAKRTPMREQGDRANVIAGRTTLPSPQH